MESASQMWAKLRQKKNWKNWKIGDHKEGRGFASFVLWNVPFIDLRELNKSFVLFCFVFVA